MRNPYSSVSSDPAERVKSLLVHYILVSWKNNGLHLNSDNIVEIADIVDNIIEAAIKRIEDRMNEK